MPVTARARSRPRQRVHGVVHREGVGQVARQGHEGLLEIGAGDLDVAERHPGAHERPDGGVGVEGVEDDLGPPHTGGVHTVELAAEASGVHVGGDETDGGGGRPRPP